jgi:hypothetical protein
VALVEIEDALVPAFIVEEHDDGAYTVFVPSVPTPAAGAIYILPRERVHQVDVSFARAAAVITKWGAGTRDLRAAMRTAGSADSGRQAEYPRQHQELLAPPTARRPAGEKAPRVSGRRLGGSDDLLVDDDPAPVRDMDLYRDVTRFVKDCNGCVDNG